jgi:hypothetical protein
MLIIADHSRHTIPSLFSAISPVWRARFLKKDFISKDLGCFKFLKRGILH